MCFHWVFSPPVCLWVPAPLFPDLKREVRVPSALAMVRRGRLFWARETLLKKPGHYKTAVDRRRVPAPPLQAGQRVWLSTRNLNLRGVSRKLTPCFVGLFPISKLINPVSVRLKLPKTIRVHPTFHASCVKPALESNLVPRSRPPPRIIDGVSCLHGPATCWTLGVGARVCSI